MLTLLVILSIGAIAWLSTGCNRKSIRIKPLKWFEWLYEKPDSTYTLMLDEKAAKAEKLLNKASPLEQVIAKLNSLKQEGGKFRIAYFGDSIIEGDLITQQLRYNLQSRFGGSGVGFVPITSIVANFRRTIRHSFAKNWETMSFMTPYKADYPLGINGFVYIPCNFYTAQKAINTEADSLIDSTATFNANAAKTETQKFYVDTNPWVKYQYANVPGGAKQFDRIRLFYSHSMPGSGINVSIDNQASRKYDLFEGDDVQVLDLSTGIPVKEITLEFPISNPVHTYGMSFDQSRGVFVDNFSIRGYSGMYFERIPKKILEQFQRELQYELIVLQYGENVSNPETQSYDYYRNGMIKTVRYLQSAFPDVPILLISAHDRSINTTSGYKTSPDIPVLIKAQAEIADSTGCAFWNLYEAMGGKDSMQKFVRNVPPLASKDYTHFNQAGANKIADMLTDFLLGKKK